MQKNLAIKLDKRIQKVAENFSKKNRVGNVSGEDFTIKSRYALSDHAAFVRFNKTSTKDALALFFFDEYWKYFFPTDSHIFGFRCFEVVMITGQTWNIVDAVLDIDNFREVVTESISDTGLKFSEHVFMTNDTAAIRYTDANGNKKVAFFYYIHKGMSQGWRYFFPTDSHINGFRLFELEKFNVEKENYDKNFIVSEK